MSRQFAPIVLIIFTIVVTKLDAQYVDFGRNKVQYNNFDWYTLSTEHFKIYYYKEMQELAEIGAAYAEESYKILQQNFNHNLIDTVPVIFYSTPSHFRETNVTPGLIPDGVGGFTEFIKGRVVVPFDGSLGNFKHVIRHELVHVFMISKVVNVLKTHRQNPERLPPLWFVEGLAELWSTEWDATAEMVVKDAVLSGYMPGLNDWEDYYGTFFMYKMGQKILGYISKNYGNEKILLLMENMWMNDDFEVVMEKTIGLDYDEFDKQWLYALKKEYFPQIQKQDNPSAKSKPVFEDGFGHRPAYYKDSLKEEVYFIGNITGYTSIYKVDLKEKEYSPELVIEGEKSDQLEEFHFFRSGLDISSKGILAFATKSGANDALNLYNIKREELITSYSFKDLVQIGAPAFSSDGSIIVFNALDMSGKSDIFIFDLIKKELTRLTNDYYDDRDPDISPDSKWIVFSSDRTPYGIKNCYNLFRYDLQTNTISYLTAGEQIDYSPQISSDGKKILYTSTKGGIQNIWLLNTEENLISNNTLPGTILQVTNFTTSTFDPHWIDSNRAVFSAYEDGGITVRILNDEIKTNEKTLTADTLNPDNTKLLWTAEKIKGISQKNNLKYRKEYSLDLATTSIGADPVFGISSGGIVGLSDMLGNDQYYFLVFNNSESGEDFFNSFNVAISRISLGQRLNYAFGVFNLNGKRYDFGDDFSYYERTFGGYFALSYPLSFFRRIDAAVTLANSKRDLTTEGTNRRALLLTNSISYVKDNSIWGPTGPLDGNRFNLTLAYTSDIQFSNVNYYTIILDYRRYFRLSKTVAIAQRLEFLMNEGKEARRWVMGGNWDLRGYPRFSLHGRKLWLSSTEFRFPLINLFAVHFPFGINFDFPYIRGAVFFDAGNTWDKEYGETLGSIGAGARINLFNIIALRYDFGKRIEKNFTKFQEGLFHQFFFGWDF
jgi:hypothetical protein